MNAQRTECWEERPKPALILGHKAIEWGDDPSYNLTPAASSTINLRSFVFINWINQLLSRSWNLFNPFKNGRPPVHPETVQHQQEGDRGEGRHDLFRRLLLAQNCQHELHGLRVSDNHWWPDEIWRNWHNIVTQKNITPWSLCCSWSDTLRLSTSIRSTLRPHSKPGCQVSVFSTLLPIGHANTIVSVVRRPDWKDLCAYLSGETTNTQRIDKSAPIEIPIPLSDVLRARGEAAVESHANSSSKPSTSEDGPTPHKLQKLNDFDIQKAKDQFASRLDEIGTRKAVATTGQLPSGLKGESSIAGALSMEKIADLKAKRIAKKREQIIDPEDMADGMPGSSLIAGGPSILFQFDSDLTKEIQSRERIWRNRSTILQSAVKNFAKSVLPILQSVKNREEGVKKPQIQNNLPPPATLTHPSSLSAPAAAKMPQPAVPIPVSQNQQPQYNRYDQERFSKNDATIGFSIDTTGTYHGVPLKSVTAGPGAIQSSQNSQNRPIGSNTSANSPGASPGGLKKRVSKTPIIIIPATNTSVITMRNAKSILQDLRYVETEGTRENELLIQRKKPGDNTCIPYRIVDNPSKLQPEDWYVILIQDLTWLTLCWIGTEWLLSSFRAPRGSSKDGPGMEILSKSSQEVSICLIDWLKWCWLLLLQSKHFIWSSTSSVWMQT